MDLPFRLSYIGLRNARNIESVKLILDDGRHHDIPERGRGRFSRGFDEPLMFPTEKLSLSVGRKNSLFGLSRSSETVSELISISSIEILSRLQGKGVHKNGGKVSITLGVLSVTIGVTMQTKPAVTTPNVHTNPEARQATAKQLVLRPRVADTARSAGTHVPTNTPASAKTLAPADTPANREGLRPTTEDLIRQCPRFRVLVVGKSGVGKSTLINEIFGVKTANVAVDKPGEADIEQEFTSQENDRLILHDSKGFEAGDAGNYETVKSFIENRKKMPDIKDQLHAVWLCFQIPIPTYGERLLEDAAEAFLKIREEVLGNIVFTKHDRLVSFMRQKMPSDPEAGERYLQEYCVQPIQDFTKDGDIAHVAVSSKLRYEQGLKDLISLTQDMVSMSFTSPENQVSPVPLAAAGAQRMLPTLKVKLSIAVGKQRYWRALDASANFGGYTMEDCLGVIHTDIVAVWNFYDPCEYLYSQEFRNLMMTMAEKVDASAAPHPHPSRSDSDTFSEGATPLMGLAPVILPLNAYVTLGKWVYETYQRLQDAHTKFMAYIVDLTHVLEILFSLTAGIRAKKLTRTAIKLAYQGYNGSEWMTYTHMDIRYFQCPTTARDAVLEKITSMIPSGDREVRVSRALETIPRVDLERDEEWDQQLS